MNEKIELELDEHEKEVLKESLNKHRVSEEDIPVIMSIMGRIADELDEDIRSDIPINRTEQANFDQNMQDWVEELASRVNDADAVLMAFESMVKRYGKVFIWTYLPYIMDLFRDNNYNDSVNMVLETCEVKGKYFANCQKLIHNRPQ
jgi:hypothetical protein